MVAFKSARLKIKRADEHIADVNRIVSAYNSGESQCVLREINSQTGNQILKYDFKNPIPLDDLALIIGDTVHNLKTAADHGWFTLLSAFAPGLAKKSHSKFPVYPNRRDLESALRGVKIHTICPHLFDFVVNDLRPYGEGGNHLICAINDMDVRDKHKLLVPLARITAVTGAVLETETGQMVEGVSWGNTTESLPIMVPIGMNTKVKDYGHIAFDIILEQPAMYTFSISETLRILSEETLKIVQLMEKFFVLRV
ncbi:MAG TPA: hypothetical protein VMX38_13510 [Verrucomicrobiae bacterium]|nr:hypothetical protein [Verrucomicrobiae bacterium]